MHDVFYIVSAQGRALAFFGGIGVMLASMLVLFGVFAYASLAARFGITDGVQQPEAFVDRLRQMSRQVPPRP